MNEKIYYKAVSPEHGRVRALAERLLDEPMADPDDELRMLARQFQRSEQRIDDLRDHLRFVYRWISRMNGDKEHDRPESEWKTYLACIVNYPDAPWQTGDWFED